MNEETIKLLQQYAAQYETPEFVLDDPVQFPRRFINVHDIEIAGFIAQWLAYGSRKAFIKVANQLFETMASYATSPYTFISEGYYYQMRKNYPDTQRLYRFFTYGNFYDLCEGLACVYRIYNTLEDAVLYEANRDKYNGCNIRYLAGLIDVFFWQQGKAIKGVPKDWSSACKRLNMFLRWMVRRDSPVDLGIWTRIDPADLIIPLDTHVHRIASQLGLFYPVARGLNAALQITLNLHKIFPNDPCKGDFALFGYGVNHKMAK
jgi:uncharacterized protein (TIGR02757 family)